MKDNKNLIVYKDSIFDKIKNFIKNIFNKKEKNEIVEENEKEPVYIGNKKKKFNEYISFKENKEDLNLINSIRENPGSLNNMTLEELDKVEDAIRSRQKFINKKIAKLKTDLVMKKKGT